MRAKSQKRKGVKEPKEKRSQGAKLGGHARELDEPEANRQNNFSAECFCHIIILPFDFSECAFDPCAAPKFLEFCSEFEKLIA